MTSRSVVHLSEDQLTEMVAGSAASPGCQEHLAACASCRARMEQEMLGFQAAVRGFNGASLAWSAARPVQSLRRGATARPSGLLFAPAALTLAAGSLLLASASLWQGHRVNPAGGPVSEISAALPSGADYDGEIAQDNVLMRSVDVALSSNDPSPLAEYKLSETSGQGSPPQELSRSR